MHDASRRDSISRHLIEGELESRPTIQILAADIAANLAAADAAAAAPAPRRRWLLRPMLFVALAVAGVMLGPRMLWRLSPDPAERVMLVTYTVPFESAREHRGAVWLLNHLKYRSPAGGAWAATGTHVGYDPMNRDVQTTIAQQDLRDVDWVFVTDAYGVYEDDLVDPANEVAHMDRSRLAFGGLSREDAIALVEHADRGGHTFFEFNALEDPSEPEARAALEQLLGIHWTGWVGRTFVNLYDTTDVPHWFPRAYREQFGDIPMPSGPSLVLAHSDGRLVVAAGTTAGGITPRVAVTTSGQRQLGRAKSGAEYPFWFPLYTVAEGTEVLAEFTLPEHPEVGALLHAEGLPSRIPLLTRRISEQGGHHVHLMADMSDIHHTPGAWDVAGTRWMQSASSLQADRYAETPAYWDFYVPAVKALLQAPSARRVEAPRPLPVAAR